MLARTHAVTLAHLAHGPVHLWIVLCALIQVLVDVHREAKMQTAV